MTMIISKAEETSSQLITNQIAELGDWRGDLLAKIREIIKTAAPSFTEEWKWETAVWSQKGNVLSAASFKDHVLNSTFSKALP